MAKEINIVGAELRCVEYEQRVRELEERLSKTIHERDLALRSADKYRQRMRGWQDGAVESANTFVCHTEELAQENAKLRNELAEIEATTVPSGQYLDVVAQCDKLRAELERQKPKCSRGAIIGENIDPPEEE